MGQEGGGALVDGASSGRFVPVRRGDVQSTVLADHLILHDPLSHRTHVLNPSSALIWAAIDGHDDLEAISETLAHATGADRLPIAHDVARTVAHFADSALLADTGPRPITWSRPSVCTASVDASAPRVGAVPAVPPDECASTALAPDGQRPPPVGHAARRALATTFVVRTEDRSLRHLLAAALAPYPLAERADHEVVANRQGPASNRSEAGGAEADHQVEVDGTGRGTYRVLADGFEIGEVATPDAAVEVVISHLNHLAITSAPDRLLLHAGVVARDGRAVVIIGPSGRGKSTLTAALVRSGFSYLSDEVATIEPTEHLVEPFPKPLSLSGATLELLDLMTPGSDVSSVVVGDSRGGCGPAGDGKHPVDPVHLGSVSSGARLGLIVILEDPDPSAPKLAGGDAPDAPAVVTSFLALLEQTFAPTMRVPHALDHLGLLISETPVLHLRRTDLEAMVREVSKALRPASADPAL